MHILLADDAALLAESLKSLLERLGHEVEAPAGTAVELVESYSRLRARGTTPDVVVTDVRMPPNMRTDGLWAAQRIRAAVPGQPILVLSQYLADHDARQLLALEEGAVGYLLKDRVARVADFTKALQTVVDGGTVVDPDVVRHLLRADMSPLRSLSPRESEVLARMALGRSNREIAADLVVSEAVIGKHVGSIFAKLGLTPEAENRRVKAILLFLGASRTARAES